MWTKKPGAGRVELHPPFQPFPSWNGIFNFNNSFFHHHQQWQQRQLRQQRQQRRPRRQQRGHNNHIQLSQLSPGPSSSHLSTHKFSTKLCVAYHYTFHVGSPAAIQQLKSEIKHIAFSKHQPHYMSSQGSLTMQSRNTTVLCLQRSASACSILSKVSDLSVHPPLSLHPLEDPKADVFLKICGRLWKCDWCSKMGKLLLLL